MTQNKEVMRPGKFSHSGARIEFSAVNIVGMPHLQRFEAEKLQYGASGASKWPAPIHALAQPASST